MVFLLVIRTSELDSVLLLRAWHTETLDKERAEEEEHIIDQTNCK